MTVPASPRSARWLERLPLLRHRPMTALMLSLMLIAVAHLLRMAADSSLPAGFPYVTFFPAVIIISFVFGARLGTFAAILCGLLAWHSFIPPVRSFEVNYQTVVALAFYAVVVGTDIALVHWMQRANRTVAHEREVNRALAETRELLFAELQHRVSNNLQVAAGLLSLQRRRITDPAGRAALEEGSRRLALIGRISRQLYDAAGSVRNMRTFLESLCADVIEASGRNDIRLVVNVVDDAPLVADAAVPLALIVAEAISNSIEHGFGGRDHGTIKLGLMRDDDGMVTVEIRDDGRGLPDGFVMDATDSLGLRIATMLAGQLNGSFNLTSDGGTTARLRLPA